MKLFHRIEKHVCVVNLIGNLALQENQAVKIYLNPLINDSNIKTLLLNLDKIEVIDSKGVGVIATTLQTLEELQKALVISNVNSNCLNVLKTLRLDRMIRIYETEEEALSEELETQ